MATSSRRKHYLQNPTNHEQVRRKLMLNKSTKLKGGFSPKTESCNMKKVSRSLDHRLTLFHLEESHELASGMFDE